MNEWITNVCDDNFEGLIFATIVPDSSKLFWIVSMLLLSYSLTTDCCNHLMYMRTAPPIHKIMLLAQTLISLNICFLNALLCAA